MSVECPNCGWDNAYYDGTRYVCPDCDFEWDVDCDDEYAGDDDD